MYRVTIDKGGKVTLRVHHAKQPTLFSDLKTGTSRLSNVALLFLKLRYTLKKFFFSVNDLVFFILFLCLAILAFLSSRIQGNQATTITISPSSMAVRSSAIQMDLTTKSLSFIRTNTASFQTTFVASSSSSFHTSSLSSISQSLVHSRYTKTFTSTVTCVTPTSLIPVTQSNYTMPTSVVTIKGLPSIKVITAIAGVLGAILLVLLAIIVSITTALCL